MKARRSTPTEEQKAAAQARRERIKEVAKVISGMTPAQRVAIADKYGIATVEGHRLSPFNACLLVQQSETVSLVAGFQQWRRAGRVVRKGEHGLAIWIPTGSSESEPSDEELETGDRQRFILGTVFDISQTDEVA